MPMPRKDSDDSASMTKAKSSVAMVSSVGSTIGRMSAQHDAPVRGAHDLRRLHEHALADLQHLGPGGAQIDRDAGDRQHDHQVGDRRRQHIQHHHGQQQRREGHDHVGQPHDRLADAPAAIARRPDPGPRPGRPSTAPRPPRSSACSAPPRRCARAAAGPAHRRRARTASRGRARRAARCGPAGSAPRRPRRGNAAPGSRTARPAAG